MPISESQRSEFVARGIVRLERVLPDALVSAAKRSIISELERTKIKDGSKISSAKIKALPLFQQIGALGQMVKAGPEIATLVTRELLSDARSLAGAIGPKLQASPAQLLLTLPQLEEWSLDRTNWHLDLKVPVRDEVPGVQAFILIDDLKPRGGATLAIAGSHRLAYVQAADKGGAIGVLKSEKVELQIGKSQIVHGIDVSVVEMSGRAGDVYLMDLRVLHSPSINATKNVRMMATTRYLPG